MLAQSAMLGLLAPVAMAHVIRDGRFGCGTPEPSENFLQVSRELAAQEAAVRESGMASTNQSLVVDTYFHVVSISEDPADGYLTNETIAAQLAVFNENYATTGVSFDLKEVDYTINQTWATDSGEVAMKTSLRKGGYNALNVYFLSSLSGLLGYCYFPEDIIPGSDTLVLDGCSVLHTTVPNGTEKNYNEGKTVTHEVGHWLGLMHTFQGGCTGGDGVADTPAQAGPTSGCPIGRDSCPTIEGLDPIHNYMDYSYDPCYEEFTPGQAERIFSTWSRFRAPL